MTESISQNKPEKLPVLSMLVVVVGAFMSFLDSSIVNVALSNMMAVLGVSTEDIQWVLIAYMLSCGIVIPTSAFLCERFGHRRIYIISLIIFTAGSALCGLSWNLNMMIAARIIQAVGGGLIIPVSMAIVYYLVPREKMGAAMGFWGLAAVLGPSIGPTLGGYIVDALSWEWIFYVNVPIGLITILLCPFYLKETPVNKGIKLDLTGTLLIACSCFSLLLALSKGTEWGWKSQSILSLILVFAFTLAAFIVWEKSIPNPLIDIRVFQNKAVIASLVSMSLVTIGMLGVIFIVPIYAQNLLGYSPLMTGTLLMPMALVSAVLMPVSGRIYDKYGAFHVSLIGVAIAAITTYSLKSLSLDSSYGNIQMMLALRSLGFGLALMPIANTAMSAVPEALAATTSAVVNTVRQIASSIGIAIVSYVLVTKQTYHKDILEDFISYNSFPLMEAINRIQMIANDMGIGGSFGTSQCLALMNQLVGRQGSMNAIIDSIVLLVIFLILTLPLIFFLTPKRVEAARTIQQNHFDKIYKQNL